jgi:hypothetical protein
VDPAAASGSRGCTAAATPHRSTYSSRNFTGTGRRAESALSKLVAGVGRRAATHQPWWPRRRLAHPLARRHRTPSRSRPSARAPSPASHRVCAPRPITATSFACHAGETFRSSFPGGLRPIRPDLTAGQNTTPEPAISSTRMTKDAVEDRSVRMGVNVTRSERRAPWDCWKAR